jgi:DEAD/DEAH box helicase domain-containing protein
MVFWPAVPIPGVKPVAVYLDGWQFHEQTVPEDLALRQKIVRTGKLLVWSATWDDVAAAAEVGKPKHYWEPLPSIPDAIHKMKDADARVVDAQSHVEAVPFDQMLDFLAAPDPDRWRDRAATVATSWFAAGMSRGRDHAAVSTRIAEIAGPEAQRTLEDTDGLAHWGWLESNKTGAIGVSIAKTWQPPAWPLPGDITVVVGFEHRLAKSSEAKRAWSGALRLMNLLQFLPYFYVGCSQSVAPEAALRPMEAPVVDLWSDVADVVLTDLLPLIKELRRRGAPTPEALYEAAGADGDVFGTFEIAWPDKRFGIVMDEAPASSFPGWTVRVFNRHAGLIDAILETLR